MKKIYTTFFILFSISFSAHSQVVINEVYGGGGNASSNYKNDFIELYNNGITAVSLTGWSVQYTSSAGATWTVSNSTNLTGTIPAKGYYLIQEVAGTTAGGGTTLLPTPDVIGSIAISGTAGKVALVNSTNLLTGSCPTDASIIDFVGFGTGTNCFEGTVGPTPAPSNINSVQRTPIGTDTQNNNADFTVGLPSPNNSSSGNIDTTPPTVITLSPANSASNTATSFTATITFSELIKKGTSGSITIKMVADNSVVQQFDILNTSVTVTGANVYMRIAPLAVATSFYVEISNGAFTDIAGNVFAGISGNSGWAFTTGATLATSYNFNTCSSALTDGFTAYNITGAEVWGCTTFGRDPASPAGTTAFESAVQINGFTNGTNVLDVDWFISPAFDLTATTYPLLSFWSRTAFNGAPLQLKVSTDYPGTGDPTAYTWVDLNGRFPLQASNVWTLSQNINLSAYKSVHTYFAFVYNSTPDDGARWTLDDILLSNSATPPPASLNTNTNDLLFGAVPVSTTAVKNFTFTGNDLTGNTTLSVTGNFLISKTNGNFTSSISYTQAEANNVIETVYVQFLPAQNNSNFAGAITVSTAGVPNVVVNLTGNSIDPALTLEVVNWNLEWFGTPNPAFGPANKALQETNVKTITQNIGADLFALAEVVNETGLQNIVANLNATYGAGAYSYVICNYGSHTNPFESGASPLNESQKEAFVYKTAVIAPVGTPGPLLANGVNTAADLTNPAYNYFSSGRYPYMMNANVTLGGVTKPVRFVLIHAKANTSPMATAYARRKSSADTLNYTLNNLYPNDNIVLLGDFNDDLDQSITAGFTESSYSTFNTDALHFFSPTLALSLAGKKSTVTYADMIDHVELSNEMKPYYMNGFASVLTDVSSLVTNYGKTTTDHYPVFTRYAFDASILPVSLISFTASKQNNTAILNWATSQEINSKLFEVQRSVGNGNWATIGIVNAAGNSATTHGYTLTDYAPANGSNYYRLKQIDLDGKFQYSLTRIVSFDINTIITVLPNPAHDFVNIKLIKNSPVPVTISLVDIAGKIIKEVSTTSANLPMDISKLAKGTYFLKFREATGRGLKEVGIQKLVIQ